MYKRETLKNFIHLLSFDTLQTHYIFESLCLHFSALVHKKTFHQKFRSEKKSKTKD